ncbi:MAG: hypothetical protein GXZ08_06610 [Tissierellia bacterium]|nr:hypothetical protein [Tissierellia bacterium]
MIKFIQVSDIHLGRYFNLPMNKSNIRREELWKTLEDIFDVGIEKKVDFVLLPGDLYERENFRLSDFERLKSLFMKYSDLDFIIASGNHDFQNPEKLDINYVDLPNVHIFKNEYSYFEFYEKKARIYGYSWSSEIMRNGIDISPITELDYNNILLLHCDINSSSEYMPMNIDYLKSLGFDYIALGHIHKPISYSNRINYSGSPEPLDYGDTGGHGYIYCEINNDEIYTEFNDIARRHYHKLEIEINENMSFDNIVSHILLKCNEIANIDNDFFNLSITGNRGFKIDIDYIVSIISDDFFDMKYTDKTKIEYDIEELYNENTDNIIGDFIDYMRDADISDDFRDGIISNGLEALMDGRT